MVTGIRGIIISILVLLFLFAGIPFSKSARGVGSETVHIKARHYNGQTILTWTEIERVSNLVPESMTLEELRALKESTKNIRYRIYRSENPITSVSDMEPIAEVPALTGWNGEFYGDDYDSNKGNPAFRYVVDMDEEGIPASIISKDTAVYAYNPDSPGKTYYAVTSVVDGAEALSITEANSLKTAVDEMIGQGLPILQRIEYPDEFLYVSKPTALYFYTRWESPPNAGIQGKPFDYLVGLPPSFDPQKPAPVALLLHCWGGYVQGGIPWWYNSDKGTIFISTNQMPYDWWTGYHEYFYTSISLPGNDPTNWKKGVVRPYTQNRLLSFLDFAADKWNIDKSRTFTAGMSMGGSGSIMLGIRHPERFAWVNSWVGVHIPSESPQFKGSYEGVYGREEWGILYEDGVTPAFEYFNDDYYLRSHIGDETPFITFSNGKNDSQIGWEQSVKFLKALQETKRPHIFSWGQKGHGQRALMPMVEYGLQDERVNPIDMRIDQSLPAFTRCSLDDNPGNGDPGNGDKKGQINMYLFWDAGSIVDEPGVWEITAGIISTAPEDFCTVDLTPRRLQQFKPVPGKNYAWFNQSLKTDEEIQSGKVTADEYGLVTIEGLKVEKRAAGKGGNRIVLKAIEDEITSPATDPSKEKDGGEPQGGNKKASLIIILSALLAGASIAGTVFWRNRRGRSY